MATVGGVTRLDSNRKLSYNKRKQLDVLDSYGKKHGLSFITVDTLRSGKGQANGLYLGDNKIVIALDAEAGAILSVAGHEVFHYIKNQNTEQAKLLQDFVIDTLKKNEKYDYQQRFDELKKRYGTENSDVINEEIAANAMFDVLSNEKTLQTLAEENSSLFGKIHDAIKRFIEDIKSIIADLGEKWNEVKALKDDVQTLESIRSMFDSVMWNIDENNKNTADEGGEVKYSLHSTPSQDEMNRNISAVANMSPISRLNGNEFSKGNTNLIEQVTQYFNSIGNQVLSPYGIIELRKKGVKSSIGHGIGRVKAAAFKAVPDIFKQGKIVDYQTNWKNRGYDTAVFAAPIIIGNDEYYAAAVVIVEKDRNSYYLHEVAVSKKEDNAMFKTGTVQNGTSGKALSPLQIILQKISSVNSQYMQEDGKNTEKSSLQERDSEYLNAVNSGDMETAQKLVDEAAKNAGYTERLYHGSKNGGGFTQFKDWQYFTPDKEYAMRYTDNDSEDSLYGVYAKFENPFDTRISQIRNVYENEFYGVYSRTDLQKSGLPDWTDGYDLVDFFEENDYDYDAILLDEGGDPTENGVKKRGISYVIKKSAQIKSAEAVTYDDNGNVIPLSERFNAENADIRYSLQKDFKNAYEGREESLMWRAVNDMALKKSYEYGEQIHILTDTEQGNSEKLTILTADTDGNFNIKNVYYLKTSDYNIHENHKVLDVIIELENRGESSAFIRNVFRCYSFDGKEPIPYIYNTKSHRFNRLGNGNRGKSSSDVRLDSRQDDNGGGSPRSDEIDEYTRSSLKENQEIIEAHERLLSENKNLRTANQILREEFSRTDGHTFGAKARNNTQTIAKRLIRQYKSEANAEDIQRKIYETFEFLARNGDVTAATKSLIAIGEEVVSESKFAVNNSYGHTYAVDGMNGADIYEAATSFAYNAIGQFMKYVTPTFADKQAYKLEKTVDKYETALKKARARQSEIIREKNAKITETKAYVSYELMTAEEFEKKTGRTLPKKYHKSSSVERVKNNTSVDDIDYMSNSFRPEYSQITTSVRVGKKSIALKKVKNSQFSLYTDTDASRRSKAVRLAEKNLRAVREMIPKGFKMPITVVVDFEKHGLNPSAIAGYDKVSGIMYLNSKYDTAEKILAFVSKNNGEFANSTVYAPILHELGHNHYEKCIKQLAKSKNIAYNKAKDIIDAGIVDFVHSYGTSELLYQYISEYAYRGFEKHLYTEVVAECFSISDKDNFAKCLIDNLEMWL